MGCCACVCEKVTYLDTCYDVKSVVTAVTPDYLSKTPDFRSWCARRRLNETVCESAPLILNHCWLRVNSALSTSHSDASFLCVSVFNKEHPVCSVCKVRLTFQRLFERTVSCDNILTVNMRNFTNPGNISRKRWDLFRHYKLCEPFFFLLTPSAILFFKMWACFLIRQLLNRHFLLLLLV